MNASWMWLKVTNSRVNLFSRVLHTGNIMNVFISARNSNLSPFSVPSTPTPHPTRRPVFCSHWQSSLAGWGSSCWCRWCPWGTPPQEVPSPHWQQPVPRTWSRASGSSRLPSKTKSACASRRARGCLDARQGQSPQCFQSVWLGVGLAASSTI